MSARARVAQRWWARAAVVAGLYELYGRVRSQVGGVAHPLMPPRLLLRSRWLRVAPGGYPAAMLVATMVTANHYRLDGAGGVAALALAAGVVAVLRRRRAQRARARGTRPGEVRAA